MKRDMDLVRHLLLRIEATELHGFVDFTVDGYDAEEINYNLDLMLQAGLVNGNGSWSFGDPINYSVSIRGLTWEGHDFLEAVRPDSIWHKAEEVAQARGLRLNELPFEVVKGLGVTLLSNLLKNAAG